MISNFGDGFPVEVYCGAAALAVVERTNRWKGRYAVAENIAIAAGATAAAIAAAANNAAIANAVILWSHRSHQEQIFESAIAGESMVAGAIAAAIAAGAIAAAGATAAATRRESVPARQKPPRGKGARCG